MNINEIKSNDYTLYRKLYLLWHNMKQRCYNTEHNDYKYYGEKGIYVCDDWMLLDTFVISIDSVDGYNRERLLNGELLLDKDYSNSNVYSPSTCKFITKSESNRFRPSINKLFIAISPNGKEYESFNQVQFAKEHDLRQSTISDCLSGRVKKHKGWTFKYKNN